MCELIDTATGAKVEHQDAHDVLLTLSSLLDDAVQMKKLQVCVVSKLVQTFNYIDWPLTSSCRMVLQMN